MLKDYLQQFNLTTIGVEEDIDSIFDIIDEFEKDNIIDITNDIKGIYRYHNDLENMY